MPQRILVTPDQLQGDRLALSPDQSHYLTRVLRLVAGDSFVAIFENPVQPLDELDPGRWWLVQLLDQGGQILDRLEEPTNTVPVTVLVAITKGGGFDEVLRQLTELGVAVIVPLQTERTVVVPGANKIKRWKRIIAEAAEQCERSPLPKLFDPMPWSEALALPWTEESEPMEKLICAARYGEGRSLLTALQTTLDEPATPTHWAIAIGPEGGWTEEEKNLAIGTGFEAVSLGGRILRAVTAAVTVGAIAAAVWESREH
ncbi:MAG: RsmE family RNA methyltransferase [Cyanobacteria bacterium P01_F01_bin.153]